MRIGILTQPLANNYGCLLQNFALQNVLKKMGHDPITLNIPYKHIDEKCDLLRCAWRFVKRIKGDKSILFLNAKNQLNFFNNPGTNQKKFIHNYLNVVEVNDGLSEFFQNRDDFNAVVVGSDQVWRKAFSPDLPSYFFRDVPAQTKKIAYAASFGTDKSDIPLEEIPYYKSLVQKIHHVSVREKSGINICKSIFNRDAVLVLDPTLLLNAKDYIQLLGIKESSETNTLAVYLLDRNKNSDVIIKAVAGKLGLKPVYIGVPARKGFPSVESWITTISNSKFVITDSFHGTTFSIIFNKQFLTLSNSGRGNSRMETLLGIVDLRSRMICANDGSSTSNITAIDYQKVSERLELMRKTSINFLQTALSE